MNKRSHKDIMKDISNVYCALSPENLSCDGELPMYEIRSKIKVLKARLNTLFNEIGRHVSDEEAYAFDTKL
jgi:hypothetical protein